MIGDRVAVDRLMRLSGTVRTNPQSIPRSADDTPLVLVELDEGIWSEYQLTFITMMAVHPDNLRKLNP